MKYTISGNSEMSSTFTSFRIVEVAECFFSSYTLWAYLARSVRPRPCAIVFRRGFQVMRRDQEPEQFKLLEALAAGRPVAAAVRACIRGRGASADRVGKRLGRWFQEWAGAHLFVRPGYVTEGCL